MRALALYLVIGLGWATASRSNSFRFRDAGFWLDAGLWPLAAPARLFGLELRPPAHLGQWEWIAFGFGVALILYAMLKPGERPRSEPAPSPMERLRR